MIDGRSTGPTAWRERRAGDTHDHLIARARLGGFRDYHVAIIVPPPNNFRVLQHHDPLLTAEFLGTLGCGRGHGREATATFSESERSRGTGSYANKCSTCAATPPRRFWARAVQASFQQQAHLPAEWSEGREKPPNSSKHSSLASSGSQGHAYRFGGGPVKSPLDSITRERDCESG